MVWPLAHELAVVHQGGRAASLGVLERLIGEGASARAFALALLVVDGWALPPSTEAWGQDGALGARLITALTRLEDARPLRRFLIERVGAGAFDGTETRAIVAALQRLDEATAGDVLARIVASRADTRFAEVAELLAWAGAWSRRGGPRARARGPAGAVG